MAYNGNPTPNNFSWSVPSMITSGLNPVFPSFHFFLNQFHTFLSILYLSLLKCCLTAVSSERYSHDKRGTGERLPPLKWVGVAEVETTHSPVFRLTASVCF